MHDVENWPTIPYKSCSVNSATFSSTFGHFSVFCMKGLGHVSPTFSSYRKQSTDWKFRLNASFLLNKYVCLNLVNNSQLMNPFGKENFA